MRVLVVTHYFPPEVGAPQARLSEMARVWAADGDDVTVLTGMPNHPTGVVPPAYRGAVRRIEQVDGYRVVRTWLYATPNEGMVRKTLGHISFMLSGLLLGARAAGRADVVVVSSPTFFSIATGWALARLKRARLVVEVRDLWPAIFVELGVLTNRRAIAALERLELAAYRAADVVVTVTEAFRADIVGRGIADEKVHTIRNGADVERFRPRSPSLSVRAGLGVTGDRVVVLYAGAHGISHGLRSVVDAAALLVADVDVVLVGEGADKANVRRHAEQLALPNLRMLPGVGRDEMPELIAAADICLVPLRDVPLFSGFIPSKLFEFLAAERPVIGAVTGETAEILTEAGQIVVPPERPEALADAVRRLAADPVLRATIGKQGREYVVTNFDRVSLARRYRKLLD